MKRIAAVLVLFVYLATGCKSPATSIVMLPNAAGGTVDGVVTIDGKPLPGATVTLNSLHRAAVTDGNGRFHFVNVGPGTYVLRAELEGLQTVTRSVKVSAVNGIHVEMPMRLGSVAEAITVTASAPAVLETGSVTFSGAPKGGGYIPMSAPPPPPPPAISGAPSFDNAFMVNGAVTNESLALVNSLPASRSLSTTTTLIDPEYAPIREHAFIDAKNEPVTTFAIDVDQASYTNVRRILAANRMPPADAVRIEEMVNYFTYRYPQPADGSPFAIATEVAGCPWNVNNRLLRIAIQGRNLEQWKMAPNNLVFLLDVSGSMSPQERLPLIKSAFRVLVDQLRAEDKVSIVVYAGAAGLVLPPTSGADKKAIFAALDRLQSGGSTAGGAGIELAYKVARDNFLASGNNRVILATDGDFNVGISSIEDIQHLIEEQRSGGVFLTTIGVGGDFRDSVLETLADKGNGSYYYLDNIAEAKKVFERQLTGTLVTIAKDVKVQLAFDPALVASYRQIGYENRALANKDFDDDTKDAGELGAGHSVTALYEIVPAAAARGRVATLKLRYKEPTGEVSRLVSVDATDEGKSAYDASPDMQFATAVAEFAMLLRNSPNRGTSTYADALHLARLAQGEDLDGLREEFIRLADAARVLSGESAPMVAGQ